jgi:cytochrome P450
LLYHHRKLIFRPKALEHIPSIPFVESFKAVFSRTPQDEVEAEFRKYTTEGVYKYWSLNNWEVTISKYEYAKDHLSESVEDLPKWTFPDKHPVRRFMGDGLFFSNGQKWITHRRIANPAFNRALSPEVVGKTVFDLITLLDKLDDQPLDIYKVMQRTTIQVFGKVAFSYDFKGLENLETKHDILWTYEELLRLLRDPVIYFLPWLNNFPTKHNVEFENNLVRFNGYMFEIVQNKKKRNSEFKTF